ncbi:hypothetical protein [Paenibacillus sp. Aloe-11]|uniref:hypothetical protein n=1 Tax=Paenibacillus sp. Aloe-11 TaxID=1050222 RepID=UPI00024EFFA5|nr:hypothetical protein [Paenibacillus sp. Aloe-11]EHS59448.1 hypothetical protein WG8_0663 [Paenibacillus sp. Aloe-11]
MENVYTVEFTFEEARELTGQIVENIARDELYGRLKMDQKKTEDYEIVSRKDEEQGKYVFTAIRK